MVFNDLGQVVKAFVNENSLLTGRVVDRMFSSGSLGGLADTVCTYRFLGYVVWTFIGRSTWYPLAMMSTSSEQRAPFTGGASQRVTSRSRHLGTLVRCAADWLVSCTRAMVPQVRPNRIGPSVVIGSQWVRKKKVKGSTPLPSSKNEGSTATPPVIGSRPRPVWV